jgi:transposase-like protein
MTCRHCGATSSFTKNGSFSRKQAHHGVSIVFLCKACGRYSSTQTHTLSAGHRKPEPNKLVYRVLACGVSQRRAARQLGTTQKTIARKLVRLAAFARLHHEREMRQCFASVDVTVFDEMETFEHSKCKPLSVAVAVEEGSRLRSARIIATGRL